jgi:2-dehydro-3-deoxygluconokinase
MIKIAAIGECMVEMQPMGEGLYRRAHAGDTFNMAQYLAWLSEGKDILVSYVTVLGQDKFGAEMLHEWQQNNIDTSLVITMREKNTGMYFADLDQKGNRDYTFYRADSAARQLFRQPDSARVFAKIMNYDMIYASAITLMILNDEDRQKLVDLFAAARAKNIRTVFDTNYRKSGWISTDEAAMWITQIMRHADIVLPTDDENQVIFGDETPQHTLERIQALGVSEIAVKCGGEQCLVWAHDHESAVPARSGITVLDTTSAGDSFNAAYLYTRLLGLSPEIAAANGHTLAAEVIQHRGAIIPKDKLPELSA